MKWGLCSFLAQNDVSIATSYLLEYSEGYAYAIVVC